MEDSSFSPHVCVILAAMLKVFLINAVVTHPV